MNHFGLSDTDLVYITNVIKQFNSVESVKIFGSRSLGNYKIGSDVDLALFGNKITFSDVASIHALLEEESKMPYFFDVVNYASIDKQALIHHIDDFGKIIYKK